MTDGRFRASLFLGGDGDLKAGLASQRGTKPTEIEVDKRVRKEILWRREDDGLKRSVREGDRQYQIRCISSTI